MATNSEILAEMVAAYEQTSDSTPYEVIVKYSLTPAKITTIISDVSRSSASYRIAIFYIDLTNTISGKVYKRQRVMLSAPAAMISITPANALLCENGAFLLCENGAYLVV